MKGLLNVVGIILMVGGVALGLDGLKVIHLIASGHTKRWLALGALLFIAGLVILLVGGKKK